MRIGIDFDGVIADTVALMLDYARGELGLAIEPAVAVPPRVFAVIPERVYAKILHAMHATSLALDVRPMPGVAPGVAALGAQHELVVVTSRYGPQLDFAREWLRTAGLPLDRIVSSAGTAKAGVAATLGLDALLDDIPSNLDAFPGGTQGLLMTAPYNMESSGAGIIRVDGWPEAVEAFARLDAGGAAARRYSPGASPSR